MSTNPCPRDHDESDLRLLANGQRICVPCRRLREKRKRTRRGRSWPFVELLPGEECPCLPDPVSTGFNLGHHRIKGEHLTRIDHEEDQ